MALAVLPRRCRLNLRSVMVTGGPDGGCVGNQVPERPASYVLGVLVALMMAVLSVLPFEKLLMGLCAAWIVLMTASLLASRMPCSAAAAPMVVVSSRLPLGELLTWGCAAWIEVMAYRLLWCAAWIGVMKA